MNCWVCAQPAKTRCTKCGADTCPQHATFYVDSCNRAITENAPPECTMCNPPQYPRPYPLIRAIERGEWDID